MTFILKQFIIQPMSIFKNYRTVADYQ